MELRVSMLYQLVQGRHIRLVITKAFEVVLRISVTIVLLSIYQILLVRFEQFVFHFFCIMVVLCSQFFHTGIRKVRSL